MTTAARTIETLIGETQGLVRSLAVQIHRRLPPQVDLEDLVGYGQIGLAEAARDFDPNRGGQFSTFAYYRIRGSIYDGLSKMTWFKRSQYHKMRYQRLAGEVLSVAADEAGPATNAPADDAQWLAKLAGTLAVIYLSSNAGSDDDGPMDLPDPDAEAPQQKVIEHETSKKLHDLIDELPDDEGRLIRAAYFEGLTLKEAGERIGVSKAWASRLHARTLERLARSLRQIGICEP